MTNRLINLLAFFILTALWIGFLAVLLLNPALLDSAWQTLRAWPVILQILVGILILPVVLGLWVWQSGWAIWLRILLVAGLAWVTIYTFYPWKKTSPKP